MNATGPPQLGSSYGALGTGTKSWPLCYAQFRVAGHPFGLRQYSGGGSGPLGFPVSATDGITLESTADFGCYDWVLLNLFTAGGQLPAAAAGNLLGGACDAAIGTWGASVQAFQNSNGPDTYITGMYHEADTGNLTSGWSPSAPSPAAVLAMHAYIYPRFVKAAAAAVTTGSQRAAYGQIFTIWYAVGGGTAGQATWMSYWQACAANSALPHLTVAPAAVGGTISNIGAWGSAYGGSGILTVTGSTAAYPAATSAAPQFVQVITSTGTALLEYTGKTATTFTGCTYIDNAPGGVIASGAAVDGNFDLDYYGMDMDGDNTSVTAGPAIQAGFYAAVRANVPGCCVHVTEINDPLNATTNQTDANRATFLDNSWNALVNAAAGNKSRWTPSFFMYWTSTADSPPQFDWPPGTATTAEIEVLVGKSASGGAVTVTVQTAAVINSSAYLSGILQAGSSAVAVISSSVSEKVSADNNVVIATAVTSSAYLGAAAVTGASPAVVITASLSLVTTGAPLASQVTALVASSGQQEQQISGAGVAVAAPALAGALRIVGADLAPAAGVVIMPAVLFLAAAYASAGPAAAVTASAQLIASAGASVPVAVVLTEVVIPGQPSSPVAVTAGISASSGLNAVCGAAVPCAAVISASETGSAYSDGAVLILAEIINASASSVLGNTSSAAASVTITALAQRSVTVSGVSTAGAAVITAGASHIAAAAASPVVSAAISGAAARNLVVSAGVPAAAFISTAATVTRPGNVMFSASGQASARALVVEMALVAMAASGTLITGAQVSSSADFTAQGTLSILAVTLQPSLASLTVSAVITVSMETQVVAQQIIIWPDALASWSEITADGSWQVQAPAALPETVSTQGISSGEYG